MKKGKPYFSPISFNAIAVIYILAFIPIAVAFVSNIGANTNDDNFQNMTKNGNEIYSDPSLIDGTKPISWFDNGDDLSQFYRTNYATSDKMPQASDCFFIEDGYCQGLDNDTMTDLLDTDAFGGFIYLQDCDTTPFNAQNNILHNCPFARPPPYNITLSPFEMRYDGSYYWQGTDTHAEPFQGVYENNLTPPAYAGDSGNTFSIRLNNLMMNQLVQGEMVDSLRLRIFDYNDFSGGNMGADNYNCGASVFRNFTIETTLTQFYNGESNTLPAYTMETDNSFYAEQIPIHFLHDGCYIGYEILLDFNGFDTRNMFNFVDGGHWNESFIILEMKFEREDGLPISGTNLGFNGIGNFVLAVDFTEIDAQQVNFQTNIGLGVISVGNVVLAMASTPYWDPFKNWFKGRL
jgi:hypothetical protein